MCILFGTCSDYKNYANLQKVYDTNSYMYIYIFIYIYIYTHTHTHTHIHIHYVYTQLHSGSITENLVRGIRCRSTGDDS